jgi:zinc transport system substrate-binding protein
MIRKTFALALIPVIFSCSRNAPVKEARIITVSIAPFEYFVNEIAGDDFIVNVMVPAGANPHIYEPYPDQIAKLRKSVAYISNGYLGFEMTWLDRFHEMNKSMIRHSIGGLIDPIEAGHEHEAGQAEGADPHYWVSPGCAVIIAESVRDLVIRLNPSGKVKYEANASELIARIRELDLKAEKLFSGFSGTPFMIYHPNLAYLARDYGLEEVPVEFEGKEPLPSRLKYLIDFAREKKINTIFVQKEYDSKNAKAIADEIGAEVVVIDPLSPDWLKATTEMIEKLHFSFTGNSQ